MAHCYFLSTLSVFAFELLYDMIIVVLHKSERGIVFKMRKHVGTMVKKHMADIQCCYGVTIFGVKSMLKYY